MFCLSAAAAVRSGLQLTRWAPLMSTAVLQCVQLLQPGDSYLQCRYQRLAGPGYKLYFLFPYAGNNSTKGESVQATLSATLLEKSQPNLSIMIFILMKRTEPRTRATLQWVLK